MSLCEKCSREIDDDLAQTIEALGRVGGDSRPLETLGEVEAYYSEDIFGTVAGIRVVGSHTRGDADYSLYEVQVDTTKNNKQFLRTFYRPREGAKVKIRIIEYAQR